MASLLGLNPGDYTPSALHYPDRTFRENNCYGEIWMELLHARGIDPAFACTVDFVGDQWTFFKPALDEMTRLHAVDVNETQLYRQWLAELIVPAIVSGLRFLSAKVPGIIAPRCAIKRRGT